MGKWGEDQQILLKAYRQVEEPDGLISFNTRADFDAHFITWEQDGDWVKVRFSVGKLGLPSLIALMLARAGSWIFRYTGCTWIERDCRYVGAQSFGKVVQVS